MTSDYLSELDALCNSELALHGYAEVEGLFPEYPIFPRAVSLALPLPHESLVRLAEGPTLAYYAAYQDLNTRLNALSKQVCTLLEDAGWQSLACPATVSQRQLEALGTTQMARVPHKTVATCAGLGWIGKNALLVTRRYGPRVRLASVLTRAPLPTAVAISNNYCGTCRRCVEACPAGAIHGIAWRVGVARDALVDVNACAATAHRLTRERVNMDDTVCGVCLAVCPVGNKLTV